MTNNFYKLLTKHTAKLASIYNNYEKNYKALGSYNYLKNSLFMEDAKPAKPVNLEKGIWHVFFMDKNNCYIHNNNSFFLEKIDLTKYKFYPADPLESFGLTSANENVKEYIRKVYGAPPKTGFCKIPLKELDKLNIFTQFRYIGNLVSLEIALHDCHSNFNIFYGTKTLRGLRGRFSCWQHNVFILTQFYFPPLLDIKLYGSSLLGHNLTCNTCSDTSKHRLLRNLSEKVKTNLLAVARTLKYNQERVEKEIDILQYHLDSYTPSLYKKSDENNTENNLLTNKRRKQERKIKKNEIIFK